MALFIIFDLKTPKGGCLQPFLTSNTLRVDFHHCFYFKTPKSGSDYYFVLKIRKMALFFISQLRKMALLDIFDFKTHLLQSYTSYKKALTFLLSSTDDNNLS